MAYIALLLLLALAVPSFYQSTQLRTGSRQCALVAAIGMTLVILTRQIDISIGSQLSICGVVAGSLAKAGLPMPLVFLAVMGIGGLLVR